jgi:hypothetical protein
LAKSAIAATTPENGTHRRRQVGQKDEIAILRRKPQGFGTRSR